MASASSRNLDLRTWPCKQVRRNDISYVVKLPVGGDVHLRWNGENPGSISGAGGAAGSWLNCKINFLLRSFPFRVAGLCLYCCWWGDLLDA
jgi:hypothetical protein